MNEIIVYYFCRIPDPEATKPDDWYDWKFDSFIFMKEKKINTKSKI